MTHEQLVEKVARAMCQAALDSNGSCYSECEATGKCCGLDISIPDARAAIAAIYEAMREPSGAMNVVGGLAFEDGFFGAEKLVFDSAADAWQAMLQASPLKGE